MKFAKKAVSPLIATVLLISFAVALGAVVMAFGSRVFESPVSAGCLNIDLKIAGACYDSSKKIIKLNLENKGEVSIDSMNLWVFGSGVVMKEIKDSLKQGDLLVKEIEYNNEISGDIKGLLLIPSIKRKDMVAGCLSNTVTIQQVAGC